MWFALGVLAGAMLTLAAVYVWIIVETFSR